MKNVKTTLLLLLVKLFGRVEPQDLLMSRVPSPSFAERWSRQLFQYFFSRSKVINLTLITLPSGTMMILLVLKFLG